MYLIGGMTTHFSGVLQASALIAPSRYLQASCSLVTRPNEGEITSISGLMWHIPLNIKHEEINYLKNKVNGAWV
jgi:hypothetical protein